MLYKKSALLLIPFLWIALSCTPKILLKNRPQKISTVYPDSLNAYQDTLSETESFLKKGEEFVKTVNLDSVKKTLEEQKEILNKELSEFNIFVPIDKEAVAEWVQYYLGPGRYVLKKFYRRGYPFLPKIKEILERNGLPADLAYLPIIESGYSPWARSRAGAVGIWQFIKSTARKYGLRVDWWMDERRDPIKSTKAAARYLKDLYEMFGRWDLVLAAYNTGEGKVYRASFRKGTYNFWDLRRYLPSETRKYVPAFFAVLLIVKNPEKYGISLDTFGLDPFEYDSLLLPAPVDLKLVAKWAGCSLKEIRKLNPAFKRWTTPPYLKNFYIRIPRGTYQRAYALMKKTPKNRWVTKLLHRVRRGESLWTISRKYGVPISAIKRANHLRSNILRIGQVLWIPRPGYYGYRTYSKRTKRRQKPPKGYFYHIAKRGESLWTISRKYHVSVRAIKRWNHLRTSRIKPGQKLLIKKKTYAKRSRKKGYLTYVVRSGDTIYDIAHRYGISVRKLMRINSIKNPRRLRPGKVLKIPAS